MVTVRHALEAAKLNVADVVDAASGRKAAPVCNDQHQ